MNQGHVLRGYRLISFCALIALCATMLGATPSYAVIGTVADTDADLVAGQAAFTTNLNPSPPTGLDSLNAPTGVAVAEGGVAVADRDNNRVLIYLLPALPTFPDITAVANNVIGQALTTSNAPGTSQSTLKGPNGVALNSTFSQLWVADSGNNRVLRFTNIPPATFTDGQNADLVLGQVAFTDGTAGPGNGQMNSPQGVALDSTGKVYVADTGNNRVLIFNPSFTNGEAAAVTLGGTVGASASQMNQPRSVAIGPDGKLYVADSGNNRVLIFNPPFTTNKAASAVLGQAGFGTSASGTSSSAMTGPTGVAVDVSNNIYVADKGNNRVLQFNRNTTNSDNIADRVFGQNSSFTGNTSNNGGLDESALNEPSGVAVHPSFRDLLVADTNNHRTLEFFTPVPNAKPVIDTPAVVGFSPYPATINTAAVSPANDLTLTIQGKDFARGATVTWDPAGLNIALAPFGVDGFVSATTLQFIVPATLFDTIVDVDAEIPIVVTNPATPRALPPPTIVSDPADYAVCLPKPVIDGFSPTTRNAGTGGFTLLITGKNFISSFPATDRPLSVTWNGEPLNVTSVVDNADPTPDEISVTISSSQIITPANIPLQVSVFSPGPACDSTALSEVSNFAVTSPVPTVTSFTPSSAPAGSTTPFQLIVNGTGFVPNSVVNWNGSPRTTTFSNTGQLVITVPASDIPAVPGNVPITVTNPPTTGITPADGGTSTPPRNFPFVENTAPRIIQLIPDRKPAGSDAFLLTVRGVNFNTLGTKVFWEGSELTIVTRNSTEIVVAIPPENLINAGLYDITVDDTSDSVPASAPAVFTVFNPTPLILALGPEATQAGSGTFILTITGTGFIEQSEVKWGTISLTPISDTLTSTSIQVLVPASLVATAGSVNITVFNPAPEGGTSNVRTFTIGPVNGVLIVSINPNTVAVGSPAFNLTINGSGFDSGAQVRVKGTLLTPISVSPTQVVVSVPANLVASVGTASVQVINPSSASSNMVNLTVSPVSTDKKIFIPMIRK